MLALTGNAFCHIHLLFKLDLSIRLYNFQFSAEEARVYLYVFSGIEFL